MFIEGSNPSRRTKNICFLNFKTLVFHINSLKNVENSKYDSSKLKERLYKEGLKKRECEECGQGETWRDKKMSLILDHINGIHSDNRLINLRILCPNCNATLPTHCSKNRKIKTRKFITFKYN